MIKENIKSIKNLNKRTEQLYQTKFMIESNLDEENMDWKGGYGHRIGESDPN